MLQINRLARSLAVAALLVVLPADLAARTRRGDRLLREGQEAELQEDWDAALESYQEALTEDPADPAYMMAARRARFQAGMVHVGLGQKLRDEGDLEGALAEFQRAFAIDPSSSIAEQELVYTYRMIRQQEQEGEEEEGEEATLTPAEQARQEAEDRIERLRPPPELNPISPRLNTLVMNNQPVDVLYETVGKLAGINVVMDPQFQATGGNNFDVDLSNSTLQDALDYLAMLTTTYWKPLNENTIFVTNDNVTKRRDFEEVVVKTFYLKNVNRVQDLQEIVATVRSVTDLRRMFTYNAQNAIVVRGWRDQVMLAEKLIHDLDKPLAEVVVDVIVMETSSVYSRDLAASIMSGGVNGISLPITFTGGAELFDGEGTTTGPAPVPLGRLRYLSGSDWAVTIPNAMLEAIMSDTNSKVLQRPQVRAGDNQPASLRLGDRIPYATGSYQPGVGAVGTGVSALVSTQFQYAEIGVNVDLTPKVHGEDEVSLHIELEVSTDRGRVDLGGIEQPVFGQRRVVEDIRVKSGEVTLLGGLTQDQTSNSRSGVPGLANVPILKWLGFSSEGKERNQSELLIALIPHIVRRPEYTEANLRAIAAGNDQTVDLSYDWNHAAEEIDEAADPAAATQTPTAEPAGPPETAPPAQEAAEPEPPPTPQVPVAVRFDPQNVTVGQGAVFRVSVMLDNATDVFRAPIRFQFDPAMLRVNEIERGQFLAGDGQEVIFTRNILNDSGEASVVLNRLPGTPGMSGSGTLVTLTLQAVGQLGTTELRLPDLVIRDSQMEEIPMSAPALSIEIQ